MPRLKVLIGDDKPGTLSLYSDCLNTWGFEPITAASEEQARHILNIDDEISLCLLTWQTQALHAPELCSWMKSDEFAAPPYVLALTSELARECLREIYASGADDFLAMPFEPEELRLRVGKLAGRAYRRERIHQRVPQLDPIDLYRRDLKLYQL